MKNFYNSTVRVVTDRFVSITSREFFPHYTDDRFKTARTIYVEKGYPLKSDSFRELVTVSDAHYIYSDRLDYYGRERGYAWAEVLELPDYSAIQEEAMLCEALGRPIKLVHMLAGFNLATGFPYRVYGIMEID